GVHAARKIQDLDLAEFRWSAFALKSDVALAERRAVLLHRGIEIADASAADLRLLILEHGLPVDDVADALRPEHLRLHADPLVAAIGIRGGIGAVPAHHLAIAENLCAGGADVRGRTRTGLPAAKKLDLARNREILVL